MASRNCDTHLAIAATIEEHLPFDLVCLVNAYHDCWGFKEPIPVEPVFAARTTLIATDRQTVAARLAPVVFTDRPHFWLDNRLVTHPTGELESFMSDQHRAHNKGAPRAVPMFVTLDVGRSINKLHYQLVFNHKHYMLHVVLFTTNPLSDNVRENVDAVVISHGSTFHARLISPADRERIQKAQMALSSYDRCQNTRSFLIVRLSVFKKDHPLAILRLDD